MALKFDPSIEKLLPYADGKRLDTEVYRETGFFIVRDVVPVPKAKYWQSEWKSFYDAKLRHDRNVNTFNPVHVNEATPPTLSNVHETPEILDVMEQLYPDLSLFMQRFVIKDRYSRDKVFVHNDFCYDYGFQEKTTVFIPLSPSNAENGGISFYPGTNHLGYLGDAGECNTDILGQDWPLITPSLEPGDIALCHTCTWHCSPPHRGGPDRILVQATYQPASDPSSTVLLRGSWRRKYDLSAVPRETFFKRSRSSRLRELQELIDASHETQKSA